MSYLLAILAGTTYYTIIESITGKSVGKFITKTRVVKSDFSKPNTLNLIGRNICRYLPFEPFSFLGSVPRRWHDTASDTYVIDEKTIG